MNHKRRRPKNRRAGCILCKPWKMNHAKEKDKPRVQSRIAEMDHEIRSLMEAKGAGGQPAAGRNTRSKN